MVGTGTWPLTLTQVSQTLIVGGGGNLGAIVASNVDVTITVTYVYAASVSGDPQFVGLQAQSFQVHGAPDAYFALISANNYYVNARFDYIATGHCDYNETACFSHPGTYMGTIFAGMEGASVLVQSGPHATGFATVTVNDKPMYVGARIALPLLGVSSYVHLLDHNKLVLVLDSVVLTIMNSDNFVNFDLTLTDSSLLDLGGVRHVVPNLSTPSSIATLLTKWYGASNPLHGLIGQTWRNVVYANQKLYQGDITEYLLNNIADHNFVYSLYAA